MRETNKISRRQFLKIVAVSGAAGVALKFGLHNLGKVEMVNETRLLMGTAINLTLIGAEKNQARQAIRGCFERMAALEKIMSRYIPDSQLSHLNRTGEIQNSDPELLKVVFQAQQLSEITSGAFDITIKPLIDLYQSHQERGIGLPSGEALEDALALVDYRGLKIEGSRIYFSHPRMSITLDGIAKGYIVDLGVGVLRACGFTDVLVEAGGDLMGAGSKADQTPWKIGVQAPRGESGEMLASFSLQDQAVATSGDYMQSFTQDFSQHHILDPRTGCSSPDLASVSVIAGNAMLADGLATAAMVMGEREGMALIESLKGIEAFLICKDLSNIKTSGFYFLK